MSLLRLWPEGAVAEHLVPIGWSKRAGVERVAKDPPSTPPPALDTPEGALGSGCTLIKVSRPPKGSSPGASYLEVAWRASDSPDPDRDGTRGHRTPANLAVRTEPAVDEE